MVFTSLKHKRVLITGAGSGIGYELAQAFANEGSSIIATDIQQQALEKLKQELESQGSDCDTHLLNVTDRDAWLALAQQLNAGNRSPDILINNAGIGYIAGILETTPEMLDRTLDINVKGMIYGCQAFIPTMKASNTPKQIINVSSAASKIPVPNMGAYAASKFAAEGLTDVLAMELNNTCIKVLCAHPGVIDTAIVKNRAMMGASISDTQINRLQKHYSSKGCHPSVVAADIINAMKKGQVAVLTGPEAVSAGLLSRLLPKRWLHSLAVKRGAQVGYL